MHMNRVLSLLTMGTLALVSLSSPAFSADNATITAAIQAGANRLVNQQNTDGGWMFDVGSDCGLGAGVSCPNTRGITAQGLTEAYRLMPSAPYKASVVTAANALINLYASKPVCDGVSVTSDDRPITADIRFLMAAYKITATTVYRNMAIARFGCVMQDFPTGAARADNRIDGRIAQGYMNLGEWDAGLDAEAALALGGTSSSAYAKDELLQTIARQPDWDVADPDCPDCETLGKGLLIRAAWTNRGAAPAIKNAIASWAGDLISSQLLDGSWGGDAQTTAYAVLGLKVTDTLASKAAVKSAVDFLISLQLPNGGFLICDTCSIENNEINSEVVQALVAARL